MVNSQVKPKQPSRYFEQWRIPLALWLAQFIVSYNVYVMTVAVVPIARDLGTTLGNVQNALVLISLVTASFVPTSQNLGDMYGHKKLFTLGLITFGLGLIATAFSPNLFALILSYGIITGIGATPLVTFPWILMYRTYQGLRKEFALFGLTLAIVAGSLLGPFLGGYITTASDWPWAFLPQVGLVILVWLLARPVPEIVRSPDKSIDWIGGLLSFFGLVTLLLGFNLANEYGWWTPRKIFRLGDSVIPPFALSIVPLLIAAGFILLVVFAFYWRRRQAMQGKSQLWRMGLFRRRQFDIGLATSLFYAIGTAGLTYTLYMFLQTVLDLTSFDTAIAILPYNITMLLVLLATFRLGQRLIPKYIIQTGLVVLMLGLWLLINDFVPGLTPLQLLPDLVVIGVGAGLVVGQMANLTLSAADPETPGEASGIYNTLQDLAYSLGISILGVGLIFLTSTGVVDGVLEEINLTVTDAQREEIIVEVEDALQTLSIEELDTILAHLPGEERNALAKVGVEISFEAMQLTLLGILIVILLALVVSVFLPHRKVT